MRIKAADDRTPTLRALEGLLARPDVDAATRSRIERELRAVRAGAAGERDAAHQIDFWFGQSPNYAVVHDVRIEHDGRVAQIDHLILNRLFQLFVCESKHFTEGVGINDDGEWVSFFRKQPTGIPSPVEQNKRHLSVLDSLFHSDRVRLPRRLGIPVRPNLRSLILVSNEARISRPRTKAARAAAGLETVIKVEKLRDTLDAAFDATGILAMRKLASANEVQDVGRQLAALHSRIVVDWAARFGLSTGPAAPVAAIVPARRGGAVCADCGKRLGPAVIAFCRQNGQRFADRLYCFDCQKRYPPLRPDASVASESGSSAGSAAPSAGISTSKSADSS